MNNSRVYLVGAGPGDPDLLTVKALRLIKAADVVVYDRLVSETIINLIPSGVAKIYAGKATGRHPLPQEEINHLLINLATKGHRHIVRLKGGDPFIFGRGSEEALALARHGITYEIVPGITSAMACASYAGIPLTHRGLADGVHFMTGHRRENKPLEIDQAALRDPSCTLAIYMGLGNLEAIVNAALDAGRSPITPAAVIERGTTLDQQCLISSLADLVNDTHQAGVQPPAMIVIGEVVRFAQILDWFQPVPGKALQQSSGKRI